MVLVEGIHNPPIDEVSYILYDNNHHALIIDPFDIKLIVERLCILLVNPEYIILTHEHYDHIGAVNELSGLFGCDVVASKKCEQLLKDPRKNMSSYFGALVTLHDPSITCYKDCEYIVDNVEVTFEKHYELSWHQHEICLDEAPGHSDGSIVVTVDNHILFSGDSLFKDRRIKLRNYGKSLSDYNEITLPFLRNLPKDLYVYPGHGNPFAIKDCITLDG